MSITPPTGSDPYSNITPPTSMIGNSSITELRQSVEALFTLSVQLGTYMSNVKLGIQKPASKEIAITMAEQYNGAFVQMHNAVTALDKQPYSIMHSSGLFVESLIRDLSNGESYDSSAFSSGGYKQGIVSVKFLEAAIENPMGSIQGYNYSTYADELNSFLFENTFPRYESGIITLIQNVYSTIDVSGKSAPPESYIINKRPFPPYVGQVDYGS